ncbi:hypothetical protein TWF730_003126 [Orbilia blumenaviensis]|uniref:C3H1-type domain-containing protein n=1 Tax=Orbilia blumenaviensis TaxID=1796055 RepID=A0AAV9U713_9PEZI
MSSQNADNQLGGAPKLSPYHCKYYAKGKCMRGSDCRFFHDATLIEDFDQLEIVEFDLCDLESLDSEAYGDYEGPISISEATPEAIAYRKYKHPPTPSPQILSFKDLKSYSKSRLTPTYTHLQFGSGFPVTNAHIQDLLTCPSMLASLEVFIIKGIDGTTTTTGRGKRRRATITDPKPIEISNEPFITMIRKCQSLRVLHLIGCTKLDDFVFRAIAESCPDLMELKLTGIPTKTGCLTNASSVYVVTKGHSCLTKIREIHLTNQSIGPEGVTLLSDARPVANILEGVQSALPSKGAGLTLTSLEGTRVHHSSYIVAIEAQKLRFKECFAPLWDINKGEQPSPETVERLVEGAYKIPGFWTEPGEADEPGEEEWETGTEHSAEADEGIHRVELVNPAYPDSQKLSDDLLLSLTEAIRKLHRGIAGAGIDYKGETQDTE